VDASALNASPVTSDDSPRQITIQWLAAILKPRIATKLGAPSSNSAMNEPFLSIAPSNFVFACFDIQFQFDLNTVLNSVRSFATLRSCQTGFCHSHRVTYGQCTIGNTSITLAISTSWGRRKFSAPSAHLSPNRIKVHLPRSRVHLLRKPARARPGAESVDHVRRRCPAEFATGSSMKPATAARCETLHACAGLDERPKRLPKTLLNH
jgi:hypothetical protein